MVSQSVHNVDWARSLVGRDWEIFWSGEEENGNSVAADEIVDGSAQKEPKKSTHEYNNNHNSSSSSSSSNKRPELNKESDDENSSVGSIIDDWYAGHVVSLEVDADGGDFLFRIRFVGEEEIYEMALEPSKVRPSARGWIKRTKALLCCSSFDMQQDLPPDTSMLDDQGSLNDLRMEMDSYSYVSSNLQIPEQKEGLQPPLVEHVKSILNLRYLLRSQIVLRSRLATIVNHHGSTKYVDIDGERSENPTESFVEILVLCCQEMDLVCGWYLRCWELLVKLFGGASEDRPSPSLDIDKLLHDYMEYGKISLVNCATMDLTPTASKRRLLSSETSPSRRPKRRRKISRWGNGTSHDGIDVVADECDLRSTNSVDLLAETLRENNKRWFQSIFADMLQTLSHFVVDPVMRWQRQSKLYIGETRLAKELVAEDGADASSTTSSADEEEGNDSLGEEEDRFFTLEEIELCYNSAQTNSVLAAMDLDEYSKKLQRKISDINSATARAKSLLRSLAEATEITTKHNDDVLVGLTLILEAARSAGNSLVNVEPIGKFDSPITRALLSSALDFRSWFLDVWHARRVRERFDFVEKVASNSNSLPDLSSFKSLLDISELSRVAEEAKRESQTMVTSLIESTDLIDKYRRELELGREGETLMSIDSTTVAMNELFRSVPCLSIIEEKIAIRADLLCWRPRAMSVFEDCQGWIKHNQLETLNKDLQAIVAGNSQRRMQLVHGLESNLEINQKIASFASADSIAVCGGVVDDLTGIYKKSTEWKHRADAIVQALRAHGNSAAGESTSPSKLPAMVDIKRISDLLEDYNSIKVDQADIKKVLDEIYTEASSWTSKLMSTIADEKLSNCLEFLETQRACRPKGLIMDPTRTIFDSVVDFLSWHSRVRQVLSNFSASTDNSNQEEVAADAVRSLLSNLYPLLAEGIEAMEIYIGAAVAEGFCSTAEFDAEKSLRLLERLHGTRRSARTVNRERLESHAIGAAILSRITAPSEDVAQGCPLFALLWLQWHVYVTKIVHDYSETSNGDDAVVTEHHSASISLTEAKTLLAQRPTRRSVVSISRGLSILESAKSTELARLDQLIQGAEVKEREIRDLLYRSKDMLKGSIHKSESVRGHLTQLKAAHATLKARSFGNGGLSLDPAMEPQVDHHLKIFSWLVRTFPYPLLHLDEVSFSCSAQDQRIPFDVLIGLFDRMPCEIQNQAGDFALISLRVRELYTAAKKWQDEITRNTAISFRGGKRRAVGSPGASEPDQETSRLQMEQMKKLAENPVLSKVIMPREGAVNGILESSSQFEVQLQNFLGNDFGGYCPDRAPYPSKNSLVGENGEFILYRLTGSPLFGALHASLNTLSEVGGNVVVETPGKATFDWIKAAVDWIERLSEAITSDSPFDNVNGNILVVPGREAREILSEGEKVFLTIPEDLKRTLSKHGIFVTTNRQEKSIRVTLKKDGAHHSVGGTVIRWCPILFECLKSDISRLDDWERALTEILSDFNAFFSQTRDQPKRNQKNLYKWFCYREQVQNLLQEGQESLVISPQKGLVLSFENLLISINNYLKKHCPRALEKDFAKKWFAQSSSLVDDRFLLLDSVLYRTAAADGHQFALPSNPSNILETERNFRDACRSNIENGLKMAIESAGLDGGSKGIPPNDMSSHCAMIAWEVELEMFQRFQGELGICRISDEYRNKARSLRMNLDDKSNLALCLRILTGGVDVSTLINMSATDFAVQKAKNPHMRAQKEAKQLPDSLQKRKARAVDKQDHASSSGNAETSRPMPAMDPSNDAVGNGDLKERTPLSGLKSALRISKHKVIASSDSSASQSLLPSAETVTEIPRSKVSSISASRTPATVAEADESSPAVLKALMKASKKSRPPPPPSLAASFQIKSSPSSRGTRLVSRDGGDSFRIEIGNPRSAFHSALYLEDDSMQGVNRFLSGTLGERGRLPSEEFSRFLRDKLAGGRWHAIPLRVATIAEDDAREYRKFYKEYETKNRIAMFEVGQNSSKLFLVTPKYHDAARMAGMDKLSNIAATYAVVLTKEITVS